MRKPFLIGLILSTFVTAHDDTTPRTGRALAIRNHFAEADLPYLESAKLRCFAKLDPNNLLKEIELEANAVFKKEISNSGIGETQTMTEISDLKIHFRNTPNEKTLVLKPEAESWGIYVRSRRPYKYPFVNLHLRFEKNAHFDFLDFFLLERATRTPGLRDLNITIAKIRGELLKGDLNCSLSNEKVSYRPLHSELYKNCEKKRIYHCAGLFTSDFGCMAFHKKCLFSRSPECYDYHVRCRNAVEQDYEESIQSIRECCKERAPLPAAY